MGFTRKFLSAMGIEADKVDEIINAHIEVIDGLKEERDNFKKDAEKIADVQKPQLVAKVAPAFVPGKVPAISLLKILAIVRTYASFYAKNYKLQASLFLNLSLTKKTLLNFYNTVIIASLFVSFRPTAF